MKRVAAIFVTAVLALCLLPASAVAAAAPTIEYSTPNPIRNKEAMLRFTIHPEGLDTSYEVEIAKTGQSLKSWGMARLAPAGEEPVAVEVKVPRYFEGGLYPGTEYHWRVTAWNAEGKTVGTEQLFTTTDGPTPVFAAVTAIQEGSTDVGFTGTVDPKGASLTGCRFRWVPKTTFFYAGFEKWAATEMARFGETVPCSEGVGPGSEAVLVHGEATGLEPGEYFFRIEGENAFANSVSIGGVPFTVSADFGLGGQPASGPLPDSTEPPVGLAPMRKACPKTQDGAGRGKGTNGKKHSRRKKHGHRKGHGKACGRH